MLQRALLITLALAFFAAEAQADAPALLPVQGQLTDASGAAINDVFAVTFTLYDDASRTTTLWSEDVPVNFVEGYFTAFLGTTNALDLILFRDNSNVYLGVKVGDDTEMEPFEVGSVPYAGFAQYAAGAFDIADSAKLSIVSDVAVQLDNDGKVHDKYTDAEAIAAVTSALSTDTTQLEAALGTEADSNPLNHARYTDAEAVAALASHTGDAAAHHSRFTTAEARDAVSTDLSSWGHVARTQGLIIMPEGRSSVDGAGNVSLARLIIMNPLAGTYMRVEGGTYTLPSWGSLYVDLPPTGTRGVAATPAVRTWADTDRSYDGKDRLVLAQRQSSGDVYFNFNPRYASTNWTSLTLDNGWVTYSSGYNAPAYYRDSDGFVHIRGMIRSGTVANDLVVATLPAGYRPARRELQNCYSNAGIMRCDVDASGNIRIYPSTNSWFSLDNITFRASGGN